MAAAAARLLGGGEEGEGGRGRTKMRADADAIGNEDTK